MTGKASSQASTVDIRSDLTAADAGEVHSHLLAALELAEKDAAHVEIRLGEEQRECAPLALQLLVSAERSFPPAALSFDERASSALASLSHCKDS